MKLKGILLFVVFISGCTSCGPTVNQISDNPLSYYPTGAVIGIKCE